MLHLRRHVAGFGRAVITDLAVQDREAFEGRPQKTERQKSIGGGERRHVERLEPRGDDIDEPVIKRQRRARGVIELAKVEGAARDKGDHHAGARRRSRAVGRG